MIQDQQVKMQQSFMEHEFKHNSTNVWVDEVLGMLKDQSLKAPWECEAEEANFVRRKELDNALRARPLMHDLDRYTKLVTTETIVQQLADLQLRSDKQYLGLQGGLTILERLYLRQLDQSAEMVRLHVSYRLKSLIWFRQMYPYNWHNTSRPSRRRMWKYEMPSPHTLSGLPLGES